MRIKTMSGLRAPRARGRDRDGAQGEGGLDRGQEFEKAAALRDKERKLSQKRKELEESWRDEEDAAEQPRSARKRSRHRLDVDGIPVFKLRAETQKLVRMEDELHSA